ncbi:MAG: DUF2237 domain-containing protein [Bacteroidota bacterium]
MATASKNIFGEELIPCSTNPMTGFFRDGCCKTGAFDTGTHTVCAIMTEEFLSFTKSKGNDLTSPIAAYDFPGLKPGDHWCLCVNRWKEALDAGVAPKLVLEATNERTLDYVKMDTLLAYATKETSDRQ